MIYYLFQAIMNDINDVMNDIVNNKKGHNIVNEINDSKAALLTSQTAYLFTIPLILFARQDILWY